MAAVQNLLVKIGADISGLTAGIRNATSQINQLAQQNERAFQVIGSVGKAAALMGTAAVTGIGFAVKEAASFEAAMSNVKAITNASSTEMKQMSDLAREMGSRTSKSAKDAADAISYMGLAGWNTTQIMGGLEPILRLSEAGSIELARASDLVTDSLSALQLGVKDLPGYLDKVAQASRKSNTNIDSLMEAFLVTGGTLASFNVPVEEATALLGILANRGYKGAEAGTAMNAIFTNLTSGLGASGKAMKKLGISAFDANGNFKGLESVLLEVKAATDSMTEEQQAQYISMIAGKEHLKTFQALMSGLGEEYGSLKADIIDSDGALNEMATTMQDNLIGQLTALKSAISEAAIAFGSALLPAVKVLVKMIQGFANAFNSLSDASKNFIAIGFTVTAFLLLFGGLFLMIVGSIPSMVIGFGMLGTALSALGGVFSAILSPIGLVIAAIAGIGIGLKAAYENVEWFRNGVDTAFAFIKDSISLAINFINEQLTKLREFWSENSDSILSKAQEIWTAILNVINEVLSTVWGFVQDILGKIQEFWQNHGDFITDIASTVWGAIKSVIEGTLSSIKDNIESALGIIKGIFEAVWPIISGVVTIAWGLIKTTVQNSIDFVYGIIDTVMNLLKGDWEGAWESIKETAESIWNNIEKFFKDVDLVEIGKNIIKGLIKGISSMAREVRETVESIASSISNAITGFFDMHSPSRLTRGQGRNIGKGLELGLADSLNGLIKMSEKVSEAVSASIDMSYDAPNVASRAFAFTHALENENQRPSVVNMTVNQQLPEDVSPAKERREQERIMRRMAEDMGVLTWSG